MRKYCPRCNAVYEDAELCTDCKKTRLLEPEPNQPVLIGKVDYLRSEMLKPVFREEGIPVSFEGGLSSAFGMNIGMRLDVIRVLAPYQAYDKACEILQFLSGTYTHSESNSNY